MNRSPWFLTGMIIAVSVSCLQASEVFVILRNGARVDGVELKADNDGTLHLQREAGGPSQVFRPGQYRYGHIPKPPPVAQLEAAFAAGKYDTVLQVAGQIFDRYKFLGWGDHVAYIEGMAHIENKEYTKAKSAFERGRSFVARHEDELTKGMVSVMLGLEQFDEVQAVLDKLKKSGDDQTAAFAFNVQGRILAQQGRKKEAVLEFLKTLLLFRPGTVEHERRQAKDQAVSLMKEMNDARWKDIQSIN